MDASGVAASRSYASVTRMNSRASQLAQELRLLRQGGVADAGSHTRSAHSALPGSDAPEARHAMTRPASAASAAQLKSLTCAATAACPAAAVTAGASTSVGAGDATAMHRLVEELERCRAERDEALGELERRQASYVRREASLRAQLQAPEDGAGAELPEHRVHSAGVAGAIGGSNGLAALRPPVVGDLQQQLQEGVEELLRRQRQQLCTEEAAQLRAFRQQLAELDAQLAAGRQREVVQHSDPVGQLASAKQELERTREIAAQLDRMYTLASEQAAQLRVQFAAQEDDRQHLVRQVLRAQREAASAQREASGLQEELDAIMELAVQQQGAAPPSEHRADTTDGGGAGGDLAVTLARAASRRASGAGASSSAAAPAVPPTAMSRRRPYTAGAADRQRVPQRSAVSRAALLLQQRGDAAPGDGAGDVKAQLQRSAGVVATLQRMLDAQRRQLRRAQMRISDDVERRQRMRSLLLPALQEARSHRMAGVCTGSTQSAQHALPQPALSQQPRRQPQQWQKQRQPSKDAEGALRPELVAGVRLLESLLRECSSDTDACAATLPECAHWRHNSALVDVPVVLPLSMADEHAVGTRAVPQTSEKSSSGSDIPDDDGASSCPGDAEDTFGDGPCQRLAASLAHSNGIAPDEHAGPGAVVCLPPRRCTATAALPSFPARVRLRSANLRRPASAASTPTRWARQPHAASTLCISVTRRPATAAGCHSSGGNHATPTALTAVSPDCRRQASCVLWHHNAHGRACPSHAGSRAGLRSASRTMLLEETFLAQR